MNFNQITDRLVAQLSGMRIPEPVTHVYNPLVYARNAYDTYLDRFGRGQRDIILLGMNPGPFGMAQTGVPFGDVGYVRDWMGINVPIGKPAQEHPKRPVDGFACSRSEVSGRRLWGWAQKKYGTPDNFFRRYMVINYCPLCFMEESGRNRTPDKLPKAVRTKLFAACDEALRAMVACFKPKYVIGIGRFTESRIESTFDSPDFVMGSVPHPSPASPIANRGWDAPFEAALKALGITP